MGSEDYYKKWYENVQKWFEDSSKGTMVNAAVIDQWNKQMEQFNSKTKNSWDQLIKILQVSYADSTQRTIETNSQAGPNFKTVVGIDGDLKNDFPSPPPDPNNVYWIRHNQLVAETLDSQKEIIGKVIEVVGATIQKIVNPISISGTDLTALMSIFRKPGD